MGDARVIVQLSIDEREADACHGAESPGAGGPAPYYQRLETLEVQAS